MSTLLPIGSIPGLPEARVTLASQGFVPVPMLQTRSTTVHTFLHIDPPEDADEAFWSAVRECVVFASAGAIVAGTLSGGIAALPTFMQVFGAKATSRGLELVANQLKIVTQTTYSDWS